MEPFILPALIFAIGLIALSFAPVFKTRVVYKGLAHAMPNVMPHYSQTTRTVFVVFGDELPDDPILVAEVSLQKAAAIAAAKPAAPVQVIVKQRGNGKPYVASLT